MDLPKPSIWTLALLGALFGSLLPAEQTHAQVIIGRLLDGESLQPVPFGMIRLLGDDAEPVSFSLTDEEGDFVITAPGPGRFLIQAEAYSYHTLTEGPLELAATDTMAVEFFVPLDPEQLDPLVIEAKRQRIQLVRVGFYKRQNRGFGEFLTREDIEESRAHDIFGVLMMVPGISWVSGGQGRLVPIFTRARYPGSFTNRGSCLPVYYLDGVRLWDAGAEIDMYVHPSEIEAVELYTGGIGAPVQFRGNWGDCGLILIWTRR